MSDVKPATQERRRDLVDEANGAFHGGHFSSHAILAYEAALQEAERERDVARGLTSAVTDGSADWEADCKRERAVRERAKVEAAALRDALVLREQWMQHPDVLGTFVFAGVHGVSGSDEVRALAQRASDAAAQAFVDATVEAKEHEAFACITTPPCGNCTGCNLSAALAKVVARRGGGA